MTTKPIVYSLRLDAIKKTPLFTHLNSSELNELVNLFEDVSYEPDSYLFLQNDVVNSILIVISGRAIASSSERQGSKTLARTIAEFQAGDTIGLSNASFYSANGLRTATVKALTSLQVLRLSLVNLKKFLDAHPNIIPNLQTTVDLMLRQQFMRQLEPFTELSLETIKNTTNNIKELEVPEETILFQQGDEGDCCYLLVEGNLQVIRKDMNEEVVLAELGSGVLFGELALLTENKRNATIKTLTRCKLLKLDRQAFKELIANTPKAFDVLTAMMMDRHRPEKVPGITIHERKTGDNKTIFILKNTELGTYFKLTEQSLFIWNLLDGQHTLQEIALEFFYQFHQLLGDDDIGVLVLGLMRAGFLKIPALSNYVEQPHLPMWMRFLALFRKYMQYEYSIKNVDAFVTRLYNRVGYLFFTKVAHILMAIIAITGFIAFIMFFPRGETILKTTPNAWILLLLMGPVDILTVPLHELAHALTTKAYGFQVHRFGVGWFWFGPMAFADTSDMWLASRGPRIAVNLAGIYVNTVISGLLCFFAWCLPYPLVSTFLWLMALSGYLLAFYNLDPMFELDGYYVLMDALDKPNLRTKATQWLIHDFKKTFTSRKLLRQYFPEIIYWISSIGFIFIGSFAAYVIQNYILGSVLPQHWVNSPYHFKWILTVFVIVLSFASLYSKIKQQTYLYHK